MVIMDNDELLVISKAEYRKRTSEDGEFFHWCTDRRDELPICMNRTGPGSEPPQTFVQALLSNASTVPNQVALRRKRGEHWVSWTWQQYFDQASHFAKALIAVGVSERVCTNILGANSPEWVFSFAGSILANCIPVGVYITSNTEACLYVAQHSEAQVIIVQHETHLVKYASIWEKIPTLKAIVCWHTGTGFQSLREKYRHVYSWEEFLALGGHANQRSLDTRIARQTPSQTCTIVYTSGTTGPPKGALLSNDNYTWVASALASHMQISDNEHIVSYLPLSHSAPQVLDIFLAMQSKACVSFADEKALQGTLIDTLREVRPTIFMGVPRIYEKLEERIRSQAASFGFLQKIMSNWGKDLGNRATHRQFQGKSPPIGYCLANYFLFSKVKQALGLDKVKIFHVSSAPISRSTLDFFLSLNIPVLNVYGMTEMAGPTTFNSVARNNVYSAGYVFPGCDLKIMNFKGEKLRPGERGEICVRGRHRFLGYYKSPSETKAAIDSNGYLHSGDEGYLDAHGFLFITGRFKELIITAGGENIPPILIENAIKEECRLVSNVMVVGDSRKYLSALITLPSVPTPDGCPTNQLPVQTLLLIKSLGSQANTVTEAVICPKIQAFVGKIIANVNAKAASRAQEVRKWRFLVKDFSVAEGDLTPTLKLKRKVVAEKYRSEIEGLYTESKL